ncbi:uncharacterized protein LOC116617655 isoform X1 [Nematostella vectensis]|uniref:uncharacterized protein LOC116617655 isoform X1 n=1 Tax=Nematostella vectensis TaxID=45351 RepID=UPI0020770A1A|nr:uncharacterized protein LOC116617655 isoform X1 [Nematostella vectensis]XP_032236466.2 uncharacterized protein LOC116617655 isoform X1 [Nematostella vectensis]
MGDLRRGSSLVLFTDIMVDLAKIPCPRVRPLESLSAILIKNPALTGAVTCALASLLIPLACLVPFLGGVMFGALLLVALIESGFLSHTCIPRVVSFACAWCFTAGLSTVKSLIDILVNTVIQLVRIIASLAGIKLSPFRRRDITYARFGDDDSTGFIEEQETSSHLKSDVEGAPEADIEDNWSLANLSHDTLANEQEEIVENSDYNDVDHSKYTATNQASSIDSLGLPSVDSDYELVPSISDDSIVTAQERHFYEEAFTELEYEDLAESALPDIAPDYTTWDMKYYDFVVNS